MPLNVVAQALIENIEDQWALFLVKKVHSWQNIILDSTSRHVPGPIVRLPCASDDHPIIEHMV